MLATTVFFPRGLELIDYWLFPGSGITAEKLICDHSGYPYFSVAATSEIFDAMEQTISGAVDKGTLESAVLKMRRKNKYSVPIRNLRYCPACAREDIRKYGEPYWHTLPQLEGITVCPKHECRILDADAPFSGMRVRSYPASYVLKGTDLKQSMGTGRFQEKYLAVAKDSEWLLRNGRKFEGYKNLSRKYRIYLSQKGYLYMHGVIRNLSAIRQDFEDFFGMEFLQEIIPYKNDPLFWLRYLQESIGFNLRPIHHILLMEFFAGTAENFYQSVPEKDIPYGTGPWLCINKKCPVYLQTSITERRVKVYGSEIWAWFQCPICGMMYKRKDPHQSMGEYMREPRIIDQGFLKEGLLKELLMDKNTTMKEIADDLEISTSSILYRAEAMGIDLSFRHKSSFLLREDKKGITRNDAYMFYKEKIEAEYQRTPFLSCRDLKERVPGAYEYMQRMNPEWLSERLVYEYDKPRWTDWGENALIQLRQAYEMIQETGDPRRRITISWLCRVAGINRDDVYGRMRYLPEMQNFFNEACETQEHWIRRRYTEIALEKKANGGKDFSYNDVKRKVQIRRQSYEKNKELIDGLITELNNALFQSE